VRNFLKYFEKADAGWQEMADLLEFVSRSIATANNNQAPVAISAAESERLLKQLSLRAKDPRHHLHGKITCFTGQNFFAFRTFSGFWFGWSQKPKGIRFQVAMPLHRRTEKIIPRLAAKLGEEGWFERTRHFSLFRLRKKARAEPATVPPVS
jgi:hypothetical protein